MPNPDDNSDNNSSVAKLRPVIQLPQCPPKHLLLEWILLSDDNAQAPCGFFTGKMGGCVTVIFECTGTPIYEKDKTPQTFLIGHHASGGQIATHEHYLKTIGGKLLIFKNIAIQRAVVCGSDLKAFEVKKKLKDFEYVPKGTAKIEISATRFGESFVVFKDLTIVESLENTTSTVKAHNTNGAEEDFEIQNANKIGNGLQ